MPTEPLAALAVTVHADLTALLRDLQRAPEMAARALAGQEAQVNAALTKALSGGTKAAEAATAAQGRVAAQGARARVKTAQDGAQAETEARKKALDAQMGYEARHRTLSADAYKAYLGARQQDYKAYSSQWMKIGDTMLAAEKRQNAERDAARRAQVAAEKQRRRDETAIIKQQIAERAAAAKRAAAEEAAAMKRLDDARKTMRGEPTGTARQQARQVIGGAVTNAAVTVGGAALLGGFEAVKQAGAFQTTLLDLKSNTAVTPQNLELYKKAILSFANTYGADMKETAMAFQRAENHFFSGPSAVKVVDAAIKLSTYAGSAPGQTANLLAQQMHSFNIAPDRALNTAAIIHQAAVRGNLTAEELVQSAGYGINLAGAFSENPVTVKGRPVGLDIKDALAMFSALTSHGFNPAEAATQTRNMIGRIVSPTPAVLKRLEALKAATGVDLSPDFSLQSLQRKGLHGIMADIVADTPGHPEVAMQLMGAQRGGVGAAVLAKDLAGASSDFRFTYGQLSDIQSGRMANPVTAGLPDRVGSFDQQVKIFDNRMRTLGQTIGESLMPPALHLLRWAQGLADAFTRWDKASGGNAGAGAVYGGAALGLLGLGVKGRNWLRGAAGVAKVARNPLTMTGAEWLAEGTVSKSGPIERLLSGTANFFARLAGLDMGAGALALLSRLGIVGAAAAGAGYIVKTDYDLYRDTQRLNRGSAASERDLTAGNDARRRIDGQIVKNRNEAGRLQEVIAGYKAEIGKIQDEGRRTGADGGPVIAQMTARMRAMERDREHLLTDANRMAGDARKLSHPILTGIAAGLDSPQGRATCAVFASHLLEKLGEAVPGSASAKGLRDNFVRAGGRQVPLSEARRGDLIAYHGGRYGAVQPNGQRSGYHVAVSLGGGQIIQSSDGRVRQMGLYDAAHATAYHLDGAPAGAGSGSPQSSDWFADYTRRTRGGGSDRAAYRRQIDHDQIGTLDADRFKREAAQLQTRLDRMRHDGATEKDIEAARVAGLKKIQDEEAAQQARHHKTLENQWQSHLKRLAAAQKQILGDERAGLNRANGAAARAGGARADIKDRLDELTMDPGTLALNREERAAREQYRAQTKALGGNTLGPYTSQQQGDFSLAKQLLDATLIDIAQRRAELYGKRDDKADTDFDRSIGQAKGILTRTSARLARGDAAAEKKDDAFERGLSRSLEESQLAFQKATGHVNRYDEVMARLNIDTKTLTDAQKQQLAATVPQIARWDEATAKAERMRAEMLRVKEAIQGSLANAFEGFLNHSKNAFRQVGDDFKKLVIRIISERAALRVTDKVTDMLDPLLSAIGLGKPKVVAPPGGAQNAGGDLASLFGTVGGLIGKSGGGAAAGLPGIGGAGGILGSLGGLFGGGGPAGVPGVAGVPAGVAPVWIVGGSGVPGGGGSGGAGPLLGGIGMLGSLGSLFAGIGGLGGAGGALGGMAGLPGMAGMGAGGAGAMDGVLSVLGGGGGLGSLLGGAGGAGGLGALGAGLGAALPWVAAGTTLLSLFHGNFFKNLFSGKGGLLGMLGGLFGGGHHKFLGLFAEGGTLPANSWGIAGERGPEVIHTGSRPLTVIPAGPSSSPADREAHVHFHGLVINEAQDAPQTIRMVTDIVKYRLRVSYA